MARLAATAFPGYCAASLIMAGAYSLAAQAPAPDVAGEEGPQPRGPAFELSISPVALAQDEVVDCAAVLDPGIDNEREWRPLSSNVLDLGFSEQAYWLRLSFPRAAHDPGAVDRFIVFQQQMLEEALYCDPGTGMQFAGTRIPFHEWPQKLRFPAFRLKTGQPAYFFRIQSERILNFPVRVFFSLEGYLDYIQTRQIAQFGLLGVAALAGLFYFGWFIASGRNLYLYFSALMFSVTLNFFIVYGDAYMYFWPDSPELQNTAVKFTTAVAALFAAMFSRPLLNSRELPRLDAGIKIVIAAQVVSIVCALVPAFEAINRFIMFASPFAALPLVFPAAWIQLRRGHLPATLYLAGWLIVLIAFLLNASNFLGWTAYNAWFVNAPVLSAPLAMAFFAIGSYTRGQAEVRQTMELRVQYAALTRRLYEMDRPRSRTTNAQSQLGGVDIHRKKSLLLAAMQSERLFELEDLRLEILAAHVGLRSHQLSELLNQELNISFADFVRKFRIDAAREKLADPENRDSVLQIGLSVGFGSKTAFNRGFAELTGMTPGRYREQSRRV